MSESSARCLETEITVLRFTIVMTKKMFSTLAAAFAGVALFTASASHASILDIDYEVSTYFYTVRNQVKLELAASTALIEAGYVGKLPTTSFCRPQEYKIVIRGNREGSRTITEAVLIRRPSRETIWAGKSVVENAHKTRLAAQIEGVREVVSQLPLPSSLPYAPSTLICGFMADHVDPSSGNPPLDPTRTFRQSILDGVANAQFTIGRFDVLFGIKNEYTLNVVAQSDGQVTFSDSIYLRGRSYLFERYLSDPVVCHIEEPRFGSDVNGCW